MKNLAIIPARIGSKGLKEKNIKTLNGKPLIAYTIEAAIKSKIFDEVIVSTESEKIAEISKKYGAKLPFIRPLELATDEAKSSDVIIHALKFYPDFTNFCLLQPTSPLRSYNDIINAYNLFLDKRANSVVSVCETDHSPLWTNTIDDNLNMDNFLSKETKSKRRQDLPNYYRLNGSIYFSKIDYYLQYNNWYEKKCFAYIMPKKRSIDIDDIIDFKLVELLLKEEV